MTSLIIPSSTFILWDLLFCAWHLQFIFFPFFKLYYFFPHWFFLFYLKFSCKIFLIYLSRVGERDRQKERNWLIDSIRWFTPKCLQKPIALCSVSHGSDGNKRIWTILSDVPRCREVQGEELGLESGPPISDASVPSNNLIAETNTHLQNSSFWRQSSFQDFSCSSLFNYHFNLLEKKWRPVWCNENYNSNVKSGRSPQTHCWYSAPSCNKPPCPRWHAQMSVPLSKGTTKTFNWSC